MRTRLASLLTLQRHLSRLPRAKNDPLFSSLCTHARQWTAFSNSQGPNPLTEPASHFASLSSLAPTDEAVTIKARRKGSSSRGLTIKHLMDARVHMGHRRQLWNPRMAPYIFGHRNGMHVIDLDRTLIMLRRALLVVSKMAENGCTFLWLGPRDPPKHRLMDRIAKEAQAYTLGGRWVGGTLTNSLASGQAEKLGYRLPDCLFVVDTLRHAPALREAKRLGIPTVGVVDSDCDPSSVTYAIPGNDDGPHALNLYFQLVRLAIADGRRAAQERSPYRKKRSKLSAALDDRHDHRKAAKESDLLHANI